MKKILFINLFLTLWIFAIPLSADSSLDLLKYPNGTNLGRHCFYLEDEDKVFEIQQISSSLYQPFFKKVESNQPGFGFTTSAIWLRCKIFNSTESKLNMYLEIPYPVLDRIYFFHPVGKNIFEESRTGDSYPFLQRSVAYRNFLIPIQLPSNSDYEFYMRIANKGAVVVPLNLWTYDHLISKIHSENIIIGIFIGIVLVMILYNLFLYTFFKELHYLYYVLFLVGWLFVILNITGISFEYLWPNSVWWANYNFPIMIFFSIVWALLFSRTILNLKQHSPLMDKILYYNVYISSFGITVPFILDYVYSIRISIITVLIQLIFIYASVIIVYRKDKSLAKYFLIAWTVLFIGIFTFQFHSMGWLETNVITTWSIQLGSSFAIILFALALADRINSMRKEKEQAQEQVIEMQKVAIENIKTSQKQQEQLIAVNQELKIARTIHEAILPQNIPKIKNVDIDITYIPMAEIGGDFYEFINDPESQSLGIFIADVTGHGIPAAQMASVIKATFTFHKKSFNKPDKLLREMNSTIISMENNQMVSAGYLYLDFKNKMAHYANSGHPPLLIWRKSTNRMETFYPEGKILGWMDDSNNKLVSTPFLKGDRFFLYTDGITEVRKSISEIWGDENFARFVNDHVHISYDDMIQELLQTLRNFSGREDGFEDDITFISIKT